MKTHLLFKKRTSLILAALFAAGVIVRLYACWCFRHNLNIDAGVVALMTRHIAEGQAFPVFFYGQAYMGSLEALIGGFICRIFGLNGFTVCLGTAFISFWLLPVIYLWGRQAGGRIAGFAALAFTIVGPGGFFHYNASPRGAYAATLTFSAFILWFSTRMAIRWKVIKEQSGLDFLILGLATGLAWWSNQLTVAAIICAGLILLIYIQKSVFSWRLLPGVAGFAAGSSPFWLYNLMNDWPSMHFTETFGRTNLLDGLYIFYTERFTSLMLPAVDNIYLRNIAFAIYLAIILYPLSLLYTACKKDNKPLYICLSTIYLYGLIFSVIFACSHFAVMNTPRYFLPMVPPIAVLAGLFTAELQKKAPAVIAWLPLSFMIALQLPVFSWATAREKESRVEYRKVMSTADRLTERGLHTVFAPNICRPWNFASLEKVLFVDLVNNFYLPHTQQAELNTGFAVLDNYGDSAQFAEFTDSTYRTEPLEGHSLQYAFLPPQNDWQEIPPGELLSITSGNGSDLLRALTDNRILPGWTAETQEDAELTVKFKTPQNVCGLRLNATHSKGYPFLWSITGQTADGENLMLLKNKTFNYFYWSGPRPFWGGDSHRMEVNFPPQLLTELRIIQHPDRPDFNLSLHSLQVFTPASSPQYDQSQAIPRLLDFLAQHAIHRLYADRWVANTIHSLSSGTIITTLDPEIFPEHNRLSFHNITLNSKTAMLVKKTDAARLRRCLQARNVSWQEHEIAPWILFYGWPDGQTVTPGMNWLGYNAILDDALWASILLKNAEARIKEGLRDEKTVELIQESLSHNPYLFEARRLLPEVIAANNSAGTAQEAFAAYQQHCVPEYPAKIKFDNQIEFSGYRIEKRSFRPGDTFQIRYYWKIPHDTETRKFIVFVHFMQEEKILFQDDHTLLSGIDRAFLQNQTGNPVFSEQRTISIPQNIEPGATRIVIGIYETGNGSRLKAKSKFYQKKNAVTLPDPIMLSEHIHSTD